MDEQQVATLAAVLESCRARIEAQTSLTRARSVDSLAGIPDHLQPSSFAAWPGRTTNVRDTRASSSDTAFDEEITIEIAGRLTVDEIGDLDTLLGNARGVRIALTNAAWWRSQSIECAEYLSERRRRSGGWVIVSQTYRIRRRGDLG